VDSTTALWRLVDERIDTAHLSVIRAARFCARAAVGAAGTTPDHGGWLQLDVDATSASIIPTTKKTRPPDSGG
jgi:hypothetical protein